MNLKALFPRRASWIVGGLAAAMAIPMVSTPAQGFGISLDLPFFRVRSYDGYYYYDNDYHHPHGYHSHYYRPHGRYYYAPRTWYGTDEDVHYNADGTIQHETTRKYVGPDGKLYEETIDKHTHY
jgi:hypothetical protein